MAQQCPLRGLRGHALLWRDTRHGESHRVMHHGNAVGRHKAENTLKKLELKNLGLDWSRRVHPQKSRKIKMASFHVRRDSFTNPKRGAVFALTVCIFSDWLRLVV